MPFRVRGKQILKKVGNRWKVKSTHRSPAMAKAALRAIMVHTKGKHR